MEQTVTLVRSQGNNYNLFGFGRVGDEFPTTQAHVEQMTRDGWRLITTEMASRTDTPIMLFWRRE